MGDQEIKLVDKLRSEGFDLDNCSTAEKMIYVWKLYLSSEEELKVVLEQFEEAKARHVGEIQEIEAYVEQIKALSDEREALTLEFETENDVIKSEMETAKAEVADMLGQQGLDDVISSSVPEQVAFLLVERAKLLDALEKEAKLKEMTTLTFSQLDKITTETQTDLSAVALSNTEGIEDISSTGERTTDTDEELSSHSQNWNECDNCRRLQKERNQLSTKYIIADEQVKSLDRRVARYKVLLGEDVIHKEDVIGDLHDELAEVKEQLTQRTEELKASNEELNQVRTILDSTNEKYESYEQNCQPFDLTQTTFSATQTSFTTTLSQPDEQLLEKLKEKSAEIESLQTELDGLKENSAADLEKTILDYEQKLEDQGMREGEDTAYKSELKDMQSKIQSLTEAKSELELRLASTQQHLEQSKQEAVELKTKISNQEEEIITYQTELEQTLANQEEELDRNERLQQQLDVSLSTIQSLKGKSGNTDLHHLTEDNNALKEAYSALELQHSELLEKLSSLTSQYETVMEKLESISAEYQSLNTKHQKTAAESHKIGNDYSALQQIHEVLSDDVEALMSEKEILIKTNTQLQQQMKDEEEFHRQELSDSDQKLAFLEESKQNIEREWEELKSKLNALEQQGKDSGTSEDEIQLLKAQVLELEGDNFKLAENIRKLTLTLQVKTEEVVTVETEKEELRIELEERAESLSKGIQELKQEKITTGRKHVQVSGDLDSMRSEHEHLLTDHKNLLAEHKELDTRLSSLLKEHENLTEEYKDLQLDYDTLNDQNQEVLEMNTELSAQCERLTREVESDQRRKEIGSRDKISTDTVDGLTSELQETNAMLEQYKADKMEWESSLNDKNTKTIEMTERVLLLEKAANQLEEDNRELATQLQETLSQRESVEATYKHEIQRLKLSNTRVQEQLEKQKTYGESVEEEAQALREKLAAQKLEVGSEAKEEEIIELKTAISQLKLTHIQQIDVLEQKVRQLMEENVLIRETLNAQTTELSSLRSEAINLQNSLEEESINYKRLETKSSNLETELNQNLERLKEVNERRSQIELDNQQLAEELRESVASKNDSLLTSLHETDCTKALEIAESRIVTLEKQRDDLELSLQRVKLELNFANQSAAELSELRVELQVKKDEVQRLMSRLQEADTQRSYEDRKVEELRLNLTSTNQRESLLHDQNSNLRHKLLEAETSLSKLQSEKNNIQNQLGVTEGKTDSVKQKMSEMQAEKETLELELMAANEKLQLNVQRYQDRKTRHRNRIRNSRVLHDTEVAKLKDKMEYLDRDISILKQTLEQEQQLRLEAENKSSKLVINHRNLLSKQVDLEDEIRERNRGIALLQTKLQYTEQENKRLNELCNRLKLSPTLGGSGSLDMLDSLINKQTLAASPRSAASYTGSVPGPTEWEKT